MTISSCATSAAALVAGGGVGAVELALIERTSMRVAFGPRPDRESVERDHPVLRLLLFVVVCLPRSLKRPICPLRTPAYGKSYYWRLRVVLPLLRRGREPHRLHVDWSRGIAVPKSAAAAAAAAAAAGCVVAGVIVGLGFSFVVSVGVAAAARVTVVVVVVIVVAASGGAGTVCGERSDGVGFTSIGVCIGAGKRRRQVHLLSVVVALGRVAGPALRLR